MHGLILAPSVLHFSAFIIHVLLKFFDPKIFSVSETETKPNKNKEMIADFMHMF